MRLIIILATVALISSGRIYACSCRGPGTVKESFDNSNVVVHGKVISKDLISYSETIKEDKLNDLKGRLKDDKRAIQFLESDYIFKIELEVFENFKGTNVRDTVIIYTPMSNAFCGYKFEKGKEYVIYASIEAFFSTLFLPESERRTNIQKENTYWTNHCTRTTEFYKSEADQLRQLKK